VMSSDSDSVGLCSGSGNESAVLRSGRYSILFCIDSVVLLISSNSAVW